VALAVLPVRRRASLNTSRLASSTMPISTEVAVCPEGWVRKQSQDEPPEAKYLTPSEAARLLHVSPKTIDRWADQGLIPCVVTLGGHRRFAPDAIAAVVEQMAGRGASPGQGD